ncbi:hypothetical protein QE250_07745 [Chromatiaceae bacterium AAb-1]|nr:hypothetical protein [Chromatiaceae bacterium AAb-1]
MKPTERFSSRVNSYVKYRPSYPDAAIAFQELQQAFEQHQQNGQIAFNYETEVYLGSMN